MNVSYILSKIFAKIRIQNHIDRDTNDRVNNHKISGECSGGCNIAIAYFLKKEMHHYPFVLSHVFKLIRSSVRELVLPRVEQIINAKNTAW